MKGLLLGYSFEDDGFFVERNVFTKHELVAITSEANRLFEFSELERNNAGEVVRWLFGHSNEGGKVLRGLQNPGAISQAFHEIQSHPKIYEIVSPVIGSAIKCAVSSLFWKPPGEIATPVAFHQDCAFRHPRKCFRNLGSSYLQVGIAIDDHSPKNGGMLFIPGSHKKGELPIASKESVLVNAPQAEQLAQTGLSEYTPIEIELHVGDVVCWSSYMVHGSTPNTSATSSRRFFVNGYMTSKDCDIGNEVFLS